MKAAVSKRKKLPFDTRGGKIVLSRLMINSQAYLSLSAQSKVLLILMQEQWHDDRPISFGVREAEKKIPCSRKIAVESFKALEDRGFITRENESVFNSRTGSRTREWILTFMPFKGKPPSNLWEKWNG